MGGKEDVALGVARLAGCNLAETVDGSPDVQNPVLTDVALFYARALPAAQSKDYDEPPRMDIKRLARASAPQEGNIGNIVNQLKNRASQSGFCPLPRMQFQDDYGLYTGTGKSRSCSRAVFKLVYYNYHPISCNNRKAWVM